MTSIGLVIVLAAAAGISLLRGLFPKLPLPGPLLELVAGLLLGSTGFGLVRIDPLLSRSRLWAWPSCCSLAGFEVEITSITGRAGRPARIALAGSLITAPIAAVVLWLLGFDLRAAALVACALLATSVGLVAPVLRDADLLGRPIGKLTLASAALGEIAAILAVSIGFSATRGPLGALLVLGVIIGVGGGAAWAIGMLARSKRIAAAVRAQAEGGGQARIRIAVLAVTAFALLASTLGLETVLGAFLAGGIARIIDPEPERTHPGFLTKLDAIGFGFLVPVFFVTSGIRLNLREVVTDPAALLLVPAVLGLLLLVRGVPALALRHHLPTRQYVAAGLFLSTSLPFLLVAAEIGESLEVLSSTQAGALAAAGLISVIVLPTVAIAIGREGPGKAPIEPAGSLSDA